jgi:uncharacterized protein YecE (DUF72 family)
MNTGRIHVGVGGWDYEPWRQTFYPPKLPKARQLEHAGQVLTATEINATHYKLQKPETFERWAKAVPDGFKFAVKASRFCTNRKALCEGGGGIAKFCAQGLTALGDRLGPILWQFMGTKKFDPDDFRGFCSCFRARRMGCRFAMWSSRGTTASRLRSSSKWRARRRWASSSRKPTIIR